GATIVDSPGDQGSNGAVKLALEIAEREPRYFMPFQYANPANPRAHYEGTGAEIADALDRVDVPRPATSTSTRSRASTKARVPRSPTPSTASTCWWPASAPGAP